MKLKASGSTCIYVKYGETYGVQSVRIFYFHPWSIFRKLSVTTCRATERVTENICTNSAQLAVLKMLVGLGMHIGPTHWWNFHQLTLWSFTFTHLGWHSLKENGVSFDETSPDIALSKLWRGKLYVMEQDIQSFFTEHPVWEFGE